MRQCEKCGCQQKLDKHFYTKYNRVFCESCYEPWAYMIKVHKDPQHSWIYFQPGFTKKEAIKKLINTHKEYKDLQIEARPLYQTWSEFFNTNERFTWD